MIIEAVRRCRLYLFLKLFSCRRFCVLHRRYDHYAFQRVYLLLVLLVYCATYARFTVVCALSRVCVILRRELKTRCAVQSKRESQ